MPCRFITLVFYLSNNSPYLVKSSELMKNVLGQGMIWETNVLTEL